MKIEIFDEGVRRSHLILPTALLFSRTGMRITSNIMNKVLDSRSEETDDDLDEMEELVDDKPTDSEKFRELSAQIRKFKRRHPGFVLLEAEDEEGDGVKITL